MLLEEVFEYILGEQTHHLAEVLGEVHLTDMAHHVCQTVLSDVGLTLLYQGLQFITVRDGLNKEFGTALGALPLREPLVLLISTREPFLRYIGVTGRITILLEF